MEICSRTLCSGCSECAFICPCGAISMEHDEEGFLRPVTDNGKCVECGLCKENCPVNRKSVNLPLEAYAAYSKNSEIRKNSSSGGIFSHLALSVIDNGGVVFGAGYDKRFNIIHKAAESREEFNTLMGSKYVQSDLNGVYAEIRRYLESERKVLFSGTPCQCSAVRNAFGENEYLMLVDFICHGVPTPVLWEKYKNEEFEGITNISFRDKKLGWEEFSMRVDTEKGSYSCSQYKDPYLRMFLQNIALRPSCYECSWKGDNYSSDITLADFWGISKTYPHMNDDKGVSAVVVRSEKGKALFEKAKESLVLTVSEPDIIAKINIAYGTSAKLPADRTHFFDDLKSNMSFSSLSDKYMKEIPTGEILKIRLKRALKKMLGKIYGIKRN